MRRSLLLIACAWLAGCSADVDVDAGDRSPVASGPPAVRDIAATYRSLAPMTTGPVQTDFHLSLLCRGVVQADIEQARELNGPHAFAAVRIFMNDVAAEAFRAKRAEFPVDSVIVKEKSPFPYKTDFASGEAVQPDDGVGGMIKRAPGYDPAHGDWEYFYFEDPAAIESGRIGSCVACHARAAATDHVFGDWADQG